MQPDDREYIRKYMDEQVLAAQQSRDREVSSLFRDLKTDLQLFRKDFDIAVETINRKFDRLQEDINNLESYIDQEIAPKVSLWNMTTDDIKNIKRIVTGALVLAALAAIGLSV